MNLPPAQCPHHQAYVVRARAARAEAVARALAAAGKGIRRFVEAWRVAYVRRATVRSLSGLSDRTLHDLGLHRSGLSSAVAERVTPPRAARPAPGLRDLSRDAPDTGGAATAAEVPGRVRRLPRRTAACNDNRTNRIA